MNRYNFSIFSSPLMWCCLLQYYFHVSSTLSATGFRRLVAPPLSPYFKDNDRVWNEKIFALVIQHDYFLVQSSYIYCSTKYFLICSKGNEGLCFRQYSCNRRVLESTIVFELCKYLIKCELIIKKLSLSSVFLWSCLLIWTTSYLHTLLWPSRKFSRYKDIR